MTDKNYLIPVWETITSAWLKVSGTKGSVWAAILVIVLVAIGFGILSFIARAIHPALESIVGIISQIVIFLMQVSLLYIGIQRAADLPFNYRMVFRNFEWILALKVIGVYILKVLILLPSIILLIIPNILSISMASESVASTPLKLITVLLYLIGFISLIYLSVRLVLGMGFVIDKGMNPWHAIKKSFAATKGNIWRLIGIYIIQFCIVIISAIPLGIGLIWTIPFVFVLYGTVYKRLLVNVMN